MLIISKLQNHNYFKVSRVEERDAVHHNNSIISHKEASIVSIWMRLRLSRIIKAQVQLQLLR